MAAIERCALAHITDLLRVVSARLWLVASEAHSLSKGSSWHGSSGVRIGQLGPPHL